MLTVAYTFEVHGVARQQEATQDCGGASSISFNLTQIIVNRGDLPGSKGNLDWMRRSGSMWSTKLL